MLEIKNEISEINDLFFLKDIPLLTHVKNIFKS